MVQGEKHFCLTEKDGKIDYIIPYLPYYIPNQATTTTTTATTDAGGTIWIFDTNINW